MSMQNTYQSVSDFFNNEKFISWRLFRTEDADAYWSGFLSKNPQMETLLDEAIREFDENVKLNDANISPAAAAELYRKIETRIRTHKRNKIRRIFSWGSVAAGLILIIASGVFFATKQKSRFISTQNEIVGRALSNNESVRLIVGNEVVALQSHARITLSGEGKVSVTDSSHHTKVLELADEKLNKLVVPYGKRSFVTLADGTKVWLNSGTELDFPSNFSGNSRDIYVAGEIYIEVAKSEHPFFVHTGRSVVQVLGTKFNVTAYTDDAEESVVLVEGSVEMKFGRFEPGIVLAPNEKATLREGGVKKETVNVSEYTSWHTGVMEFDRVPIAEVLKRIGRCYNVSFENNADVALNEKTVSGKLFLSNNFDSIMVSVSALSATEYERIGNRIVIRKK